MKVEWKPTTEYAGEPSYHLYVDGLIKAMVFRSMVENYYISIRCGTGDWESVTYSDRLLSAQVKALEMVGL